jgi:hypothetical protein
MPYFYHFLIFFWGGGEGGGISLSTFIILYSLFVGTVVAMRFRVPQLVGSLLTSSRKPRSSPTSPHMAKMYEEVMQSIKFRVN